jgi:hypothetical protein
MGIQQKCTAWKLLMGALLEAKSGGTIDPQFTAVVADPAVPAAKLVQAGRIHHQVALIAQGLPPLLHARRVRREDQVAFNTRFVGRNGQLMTAHGLEDAQHEGTDAGVGGLGRCPPRAVKSILLAVDSQTQTTVHDPQVRIAAEADTKVKGTVAVVGVIPVAVVGAAITAGGQCDGFGGLVDGIVVEFGKHRGGPSVIGIASSMTEGASPHKRGNGAAAPRTANQTTDTAGP